MEDIETCSLCGQPCDSADNEQHQWCEQEEIARIAEWEGDILSDCLSEDEPTHGNKAA